MKNKKSIIMILCFIVLVFSLNTLSAASSEKKLNTTKIDKQANIHKVSKESTTKKTKKTSNSIVYVNTSSKSNTEDGSKSSPYKTINNTNIGKISDNSTVYISKGTYNVSPTNLNKNLSFVGEDKKDVIFIPEENSTTFTVKENANVNFINLTIKNFLSENNNLIKNTGLLNIDNVNFYNNKVTSKQSNGVCIKNTGSLELSNCLFENNTASYGSALYNQNKAKVDDCIFSKNNIYNVGGAIYSIRSDLTVTNSKFSENSAVSGAAIYNAFGNLTVNNTDFYKNNAATFFGGAIYSTGITYAYNSNFYSNHANKDGGAITNTNNFTIFNCNFEQNSAGENGGTIENVAWSGNERGNLTIFYSSFLENSAGMDGGVIINYNKNESDGNFSTVTARHNVFDSNTASNRGGVIYNEQFMDFEYNVLINNDANTGKMVYSKDDLIKSIENNWWGKNKITRNDIGVIPKTWVVMKLSNTTAFVKNLKSSLNISLDTLNTGKILDSTLPNRKVIFYVDKTILSSNYVTINKSISYLLTPLDDRINVKIDNQLLSLKAAKANITYSLTNKNQTLNIKVILPKNVKGKISVKINSKNIFNKKALSNGKLSLNYVIPIKWTKNKYKMEVLFNSKDGSFIKNLTIKIPKRQSKTTLKIINMSALKAGKKIKLIANVKLGKYNITTGSVTFKVNKKTIKSKVKVTDGKAVYKYTIPKSFSPKKYVFRAVYKGDLNKKPSNASKSIKLEKLNIKPNIKSKLSLKRNVKNQIKVAVLDEYKRKVTSGKISYKINKKTIKSNIAIKKGYFIIKYTPKIKSKKQVTQTLTIKFNGKSKYNSLKKTVKLVIK